MVVYYEEMTVYQIKSNLLNKYMFRRKRQVNLFSENART